MSETALTILDMSEDVPKKRPRRVNSRRTETQTPGFCDLTLGRRAGAFPAVGSAHGAQASIDPAIVPSRDTPALVCMLARDMGDASQGYLTVVGGTEIGIRGLWLCQLGFARRESVLIFLARDVALTNKPV